MDSTTVGHDRDRRQDYAVNYTTAGERIAVASTNCVGANGVYSSVSDLLRFARLHLGDVRPDQRSILTGESLSAMQTPGRGTHPTSFWECPGSGSGLGWYVSFTGDGMPILYHNGGTHGVSTVLVLVPAERLGVVVLSDAQTDWPDDIAMEILAAVIPDRLQNLCSREGEAPSGVDGVVDPSLFGAWSGEVWTYEGEVPVSLRIDSGSGCSSLWAIRDTFRYTISATQTGSRAS